MAEYYVLPDPANVMAGTSNVNVYEIEVNLTIADEESKYIIVPGDVQEITVTVVPNGASGTVFTSTDLLNKIKNNDAGVDWVEWDRGEVSTVYQDSCAKVTALKVKQVGDGSVKATMRFQ